MSDRPTHTLPDALVKLDGRVWEVVSYEGGGPSRIPALFLRDIRDADDSHPTRYPYQQVVDDGELMLAPPAAPDLDARPLTDEELFEAARQARAA